MKLKNFKAYEVVPKSFYDLHGEKSMQTMDKQLLLFIDIFHSKLAMKFTGKISIVINDWKWGGKFQHRGLRTFSYYAEQLAKKLGRTPTLAEAIAHYEKSRSQHKFGNGLDFDVYVDKNRIDPAIIRQFIIEHRNDPWCADICFIEDGVNWVHIDTRATDNNALIVWHIKTGEAIVYERTDT